jgi:hypothetical protein
MECAVCNYRSGGLMTQMCGECQMCNIQISNSAYKLCHNCSTVHNKCYHCAINLNDIDVNNMILTLNEIKNRKIVEWNKLVELSKKFGHNVDPDGTLHKQAIEDINKQHDLYVNELKSGKTNFYSR